MLCQNGDVIRPLSQWGDLNRKHIESVVKVFTKAARRHFLLQVPIGRSDDPHIREPRPVLAHAYRGSASLAAVEPRTGSTSQEQEIDLFATGQDTIVESDLLS